MQELYTRIKAFFPCEALEERRGNLAFLTVPADSLRALLRQLRDQEGFTHLVLLTAVDWIEEDVFQLTYLLSNREHAVDLGVRVRIAREEASMHSIHDIWPTAATYQRELREMFGIDFPGSPRIEEDFILEGWDETPPYRRDFDTKEFSDRFYGHRPGRETADPATHMKEKLYS
ncbi:MAG: NADH-quinone oxidoreductase subunit C [Lysobacterales bacterium]|jgi:NADH-quinone oxidoreductase subunit C